MVALGTACAHGSMGGCPGAIVVGVARKRDSPSPGTRHVSLATTPRTPEASPHIAWAGKN